VFGWDINSYYKKTDVVGGSTYQTVTLSSSTTPDYITQITVGVKGTGYAVITSSWITGSIFVDSSLPYTSAKYESTEKMITTSKQLTLTLTGTATAYYVIEGVRE